jgi:hypothetical protein
MQLYSEVVRADQASNDRVCGGGIMKHPIKRNLLTIGSVAALALGVAGGTAGAAPARALGPAHLVLRLSDLPRNFVLVQGKAENSAQAASGNGITGAQMRTAGYVGGYLNEYEKQGLEQATKASQVKGLVIAISAVFEFHQSTGAHTAYSELLTALPKQKSFKGFKMTKFASVGNESQGYTYRSAPSGIPITFDVLLFRQGRFVAFVGGGGASMTLGKEDSAVTNLATIVKNRIAANH